MSTAEDDKSVAAPAGRSAPIGSSLIFVTFGVGVFALYHLVLGLFMAVDPHGFFKQLGPFGAFNTHYIRDLATYNAAIGVALAIAVKHPSWRVPILALVTLQFALHSVNHLVDINDAHPKYLGYLDFGSLFVTTLVLAWLLCVAIKVARWEQTSSKGQFTSVDS